MTQLYDSRKERLTKPLAKGEGGYVFESKYINQIVEDINAKKYGAYLIGGVVGAGKSSVVELASSLVKSETIMLPVKFYNENDCIENFLEIILEKIIEEVKKSGYYESLAGLKQIIDKCEQELNFEVTVKSEQEETNNQCEEEGEKAEMSLSAGLGVKIGERFSGKSGIDTKICAEEENGKSHELKNKKSVTMTKRQSDKMQTVINILKMLEEKNIVVIYDELDKMSDDVLEKLFAKYKKLFVETQVFHYFLVNESIYLRYTDTNLFKNPYLTYFINSYYISLLDFNATLRYSKMMFGEKYYLEGLVTYYTSLGNYRLINARCLFSKRTEDIEIIKSYIFKKVIEKIPVSHLNDCEKDMVIMATKAVIEAAFRKRRFVLDEWAKLFEKEQSLNDIWPDYYEIIQKIVEEIRLIAVDAVCMDTDQITIKVEELQKQNNAIKELAKKDRKEKIDESDQLYIQYSDMYQWYFKETRNPSKREFFINENVIPLQVADNKREAYTEVLLNIVKSNLDAKDMQVILLKQARGDGSRYVDDYRYTGIVVVNKGAYQVAYYVEGGCYELGDMNTLDDFRKQVNEGNIFLYEMKKDKLVNFQRDIQLIIDEFNKGML